MDCEKYSVLDFEQYLKLEINQEYKTVVLYAYTVRTFIVKRTIGIGKRKEFKYKKYPLKK